MTKPFLATLAVGATLTLAGIAQAAPAGTGPVQAGASGLVQHVAEGCGPGFFRGPRGGCRPMRGGYGRPIVRAPRCVVRPTPAGPRRFCR